MNSRVSVVVLTFNGEKCIQDVLDSVLAQDYFARSAKQGSMKEGSYENLEIIVVDNASKDGTKEILKNYQLPRCAQRTCSITNYQLIFNDRNIGFAGHNIGIENSNGEFVLCMNQDVILEPNFISEAVKLFQDEKVGAVQTKLKNKNEQVPRKREEKGKIDTTGIVAFKSRRFADRGQGEKDIGQYEKVEEVFGVNGAAAFFRKKCLDSVKLPVDGFPSSAQFEFEYYDTDFFMYKEDIDLSWRIRLYGWKIMYCPMVVAYADRTSEPVEETGSAGKIISARKKQSQFVKYYSFKNHRLTIIKNELPSLFFGHLLWILPREIGAWLYVLFFEPKTWPAISELFKQMPRAWKKRKIIMKNKRVGAGEMRKWFR